MSGFSSRDSRIYFNILMVEGEKVGRPTMPKTAMFSIRVQEGTPGAVSRVNKLGNIVHEVYHDNFSGVLTDIRISEHEEYGKAWNFDFTAGGDDYTLKLSYSNSFAQNIMKMLPNIDLTKEFKLSPSSKLVEGQVKSSLFINQDGAAVNHAFTRAEPNGMPDLEKIKVKGKETWDDSNRLEFFEAMVQEKILPILKENREALEQQKDVSSVAETIEKKEEGTQEAPKTVMDDEDDEDFGMAVDDDATESTNPEDLPF